MAQVACLTPDQQVGGLNPSVLRIFINIILINIIRKIIFQLP